MRTRVRSAQKWNDVSRKECAMLPLFLLPPDDRRDSAHPRRNGSIRDIIIGFVVACVCLAGVAGVGVATGLLQKPPPAEQDRFVSIGDSLTIDNVTVILTSATVLTHNQSDPEATPAGTSTQVDAQVLGLTLHFWNQTNQDQHVSTANWQFLDDVGNTFPLIAEGAFPASLAPNEALDEQFNVPMGNGGYNPYTLQAGVRSPDGVTLGWQFSV